MNPNLTAWDDDLPPDPEDAYQDLVRALKRKSGFGLFFVQCSTSVEADKLIAKLPQDIPQKHIEVLRLVEAIDNLYERVAKFVQDKQIDILLISDLEYSLYKYEKRSFGEITGGQFSNLTSVPHILNHLNQQRERFRDDFPFCFVFLLRSFSINYFIHRAPDFFDWRSGVFELPTTPELIDIASSRLLLEGDYEEYLKLTQEEKIEKFMECQELLEDKHLTELKKANLLFKTGNLLIAANEYEAAIIYFEKTTNIKQDYYQAWYNRGVALQKLGRYEEAIISFNQTVKIKPDFQLAWNNKGVVLCEHLQNYKDAIMSYDEAIKIQPELHEAWVNRSIALFHLECYQEAITSLDKALEIKPDDSQTWYVYSNALYSLGLSEQAKASYSKAIELDSTVDKLGNDEEVIASYKVINDFFDNYYSRFKLESLASNIVAFEEYNLMPSLAEKLAQYWRSRLFFDLPEQSLAAKESIILWLLGHDLKRFDLLSPKKLDLAKQAMEYRWKILCQRYLGIGRERAYRNLITRLGSILSIRHKIQTWISLSRDRQRSVIDVIQELLQDILQNDTYMDQQMAHITELTNDRRLQDTLLFASMEEYALRPVRNQPLLAYRFVNYSRRTQDGGLTQVPDSDLVRLVSEEIFTDDNENRVNLVDSQVITKYQEAQQQTLQVEFANYLQENLGTEAVEWLHLYIQGKSQDEIAKKLNKPIKEIYQISEKISNHTVREFMTIKNQLT